MSLTQQQYGDFLIFVESKITTTKSDFIKAMYERITNGKDLTPNMINALQNAINREQQPVAQQPTKKTFKMKRWWVKQVGLDSRVVTCEIQSETQRAYKASGHADIVNGSWCMRCNKPLTQPASFTIGFGSDCANKLGIPYPSELNTMSPEQVAEYKEQLLGVLRNQKFDMWIPKSQIEEVLIETP